LVLFLTVFSISLSPSIYSFEFMLGLGVVEAFPVDQQVVGQFLLVEEVVVLDPFREEPS
jgi:hypothetical protein